jgi:hypothetical protein
MSRWRTFGAFVFAVALAGVVLAVASAGTVTGRGSGQPVRVKGLTPKERRALQIVSVKATGIEPLGVLVTATFKGNIAQALGRGHLVDGIVALILRPKDPKLAFAGLATFGAGAIGTTARKTRSREVGVVRDGRKVTFFVGGPGFENVGKVEVKAFAKVPATRALRTVQGGKPGISPDEWEAVGEAIAATEALLPAPKPDTSCDELTAMKKQLDYVQQVARQWETALKEEKQIIDKAIPELQRDLAEKKFQHAGLVASSVGNTIATASVLLLPPLAFGTAFAALASSIAGGRTAEIIQALRDSIRSLKLDLRLIDAYLDKVRALSANSRELEGKLNAYYELNCKRPVLKPIHAVFDQASFSTTYTEDATGSDLNYRWSVSIPVDEDCAEGFNGNSPNPNQATWFHKDKAQGGKCNHDGIHLGPRGHPGTVTVIVSNLGWTCKAIYEGTEGDAGKAVGDGPAPERCVTK